MDLDDAPPLSRAFGETEPANREDAELRRAFNDICRSDLDAVYAYVRFRVDTADAAEELTSVAFLRALTHLRSFDAARGTMRHWVYGIARHAVGDHLRRQRRWRVVSFDWFREPADENTAEARLSAAEEHVQLLGGLKTLRRRDRDLLGMRFGAGLTNREIAQLVGMTEGNVAVRISRALTRLKSHLLSNGVTHA